MAYLKADYGYFGKLPSFGDFISSNLSLEFITIWDTWLKSILIDVEGANKSKAFPPEEGILFFCSAGVLSKDAWSGILLPSYDSIARVYPMTIVANIENYNFADLNTDGFEEMGCQFSQALGDLSKELWESSVLSLSKLPGEPQRRPLFGKNRTYSLWRRAKKGSRLVRFDNKYLPEFAHLSQI